MLKTVFFSFLNEHKSVAFLIDCCESQVNKFPFIRRQLKEEVAQREQSGSGIFALNLAKYGSGSVEKWSSEPRYASAANIIQATHWISDRVGLSSFGSPQLVPAIKQVLDTSCDLPSLDCITIITDHRPQECFGDVLLALEVKGHVVPLNVVYLYHLNRDSDAVDYYRTLCIKSGGNLKVVELSCEGELINCDVIVENVKPPSVHLNACQCHASCHACYTCIKADIASHAPQRFHQANAPCKCIVVEPKDKVVVTTTITSKPDLEKNAIVLARRNQTDGYFYLAKILDSSLAHEKLVEFLETRHQEMTKCSDYDLINIREAMKYSIFPGSRVLGKIDTQRFCPGTVLHGSVELTSNDVTRKGQDNLVVEYCNGEISATAPSRLVRIPESQFYWLQKFFPLTNQIKDTREDLDINSATAKLCIRDDDSFLKAKLDKFFGGENPTTWHRHMYTHLPRYDFDRNKYDNDKHLIKWYQERYRKPVFVDSDSEPEDWIEFPRSSKSLKLKKTWHDQYLNLRSTEKEADWYRKLLERENEIMRRKLAKRPRSAMEPPPAPWRHWLKKGKEPPPELQKPALGSYLTANDDRSTSALGMHVMPSNKHDSIFGQIPKSSLGRDTTVKRLLIQTDPNFPPGSRDQTEAIFNKRW